ncbi:hypothetical protein I7I50_06039 [Histoplasma capsulatum G186AR]|nr:hypothetical protein I7I52_08777 [Histoplasma capsulatum]QSS67064.1 hypothetical protein I7I50_06039 [Histoplasma capsulatum G186AR]
MIQQDMPGGRFPWTAEQWDQAWDDIERSNPGPQLIFPIIVIISDASPITLKVKLEETTGPVTTDLEWADRGSLMRSTEDTNAEKLMYDGEYTHTAERLHGRDTYGG